MNILFSGTEWGYLMTWTNKSNVELLESMMDHSKNYSLKGRSYLAV